MAHFAILDSGNNVKSTIVVDNGVITDESGNEVEQLGKDYLENTLGVGWYVQTSYNKTFRKHFGSKGYHYDKTLDAFIPPQNYPSWSLNPTTLLWEPPVDRPGGDKAYTWNESNQVWDEVV